ncbi:DUF4336 domain-containing protein [Roseomonas sp. SSH11]|uniref:DUF4336 domain-containing protein n=1 Tax=Pararoseomonas baculiformis TaxID=2820812 RepID=A0ABS4A8C1_9PROT|nr:DUF4336 domain-containing protein [Pararoseomonas baculiformis]MBP0443247.1 DUF4336 domain-containing protein [Pararoseomonas baculiformis]
MKIPTRIHGMIDYGVAALLGGLALSPGLPRPVRRALGSAAAYHTAYSVLTDYEGGTYPAISMRQHLALDAMGGAALIGAGLSLRRVSDADRALLVGLGLVELAVVALSSSRAPRGPGQGSGMLGRLMGQGHSHHGHQASYPPLDTPKPVADGLWVVDSILPNLAGSVVGVRMTVVRLPDGGLLLHSPTRFTFALRRELERLGPIKHLVAPNIAHWTFLKEWQDQVPDAVSWAAPGLRDRGQVRRSGVRLDHDLSETPPPEWGGAIGIVAVPGAAGFHEMAMFHEPSRTLMLTDLIMNLEPPKVPLPMRPLVWLFGMMAPDGMPPPYLRAVVKWRHAEAAEAAKRLLDWRPERVIFAHGRWFERDGAEHLRRSLRWLLPGRRSAPAVETA